MISALAEAGALLGEPDVDRGRRRRRRLPAPRAARPDGRWHRSWHADGEPPARHDALAADHAALVDAFTRLAEVTGEARWIDEALRRRRHAARPLLGHRPRRPVHDARRRRGARRPPEGPVRQRHAVGQLDRRRRAVPPRRADRRGRATPTTPTASCSSSAPSSTRRRRAFSHALAAVALRERRDHRGRRRRRPARPRRRRQRALAPRGRAGLGRALRLAAVGRPRRRPGLRLPALRLPGPAGHRRRPAGPAPLIPTPGRRPFRTVR